MSTAIIVIILLALVSERLFFLTRQQICHNHLHMKKTLFVSLVSAASAVSALAAPEPDTAQLQAFPKNLARQHLGSNLFQYSPTTHAYAPTQASAAWLDDDISTGWPMLSGTQHYLLAFPEPEVLSNFSISARPASGTVSLYAGDDPAAPGAKSWTLLAKDISFDQVNEKQLSKGFLRSAKYLLIETNVTDPGPVYSLYVYGSRPAAAYDIKNREQPIETRSIFGPYANDATAFSVSGLYARSHVQPQEGQGSFAEMQKAIDDNPATAVTLGGGQRPVLEVHSAEPRAISRVALEVSPGAKGRFEFYVNDTANAAGEAAAPVGSIILDGSTSRASVDFAPATGNVLQARWTPANGADSVQVNEINAFAGQSLASNMVTTDLAPVADADEAGVDRRVARSSRDGKTYNDPKDPKNMPAIADRQTGPYLPGALGFPPNLSVRRTPLLPPDETPVSPP